MVVISKNYGRTTEEMSYRNFFCKGDNKSPFLKIRLVIFSLADSVNLKCTI